MKTSKRLPKPSPYDFTGERVRLAAHEVQYANARDQNGNQPTCPYCYQTARLIYADGRRLLVCACRE